MSNDVRSVVGFRVKKIEVTHKYKETEEGERVGEGSVKLQLEADKNDLGSEEVAGNSITEILGALNVHQEADRAVVLRVADKTGTNHSIVGFSVKKIEVTHKHKKGAAEGEGDGKVKLALDVDKKYLKTSDGSDDVSAILGFLNQHQEDDSTISVRLFSDN
jgi:hypothetical protein